MGDMVEHKDLFFKVGLYDQLVLLFGQIDASPLEFRHFWLQPYDNFNLFLPLQTAVCLHLHFDYYKLYPYQLQIHLPIFDPLRPPKKKIIPKIQTSAISKTIFLFKFYCSFSIECFPEDSTTNTNILVIRLQLIVWVGTDSNNMILCLNV